MSNTWVGVALGLFAGVSAQAFVFKSTSGVWIFGNAVSRGMFMKGKQIARARLALRVIVIAAMLGGCSVLAPVPTFRLDRPQGPPVQAIVQHITCELRSSLRTEIKSGNKSNLFNNLVAYNFIGTANLTLKVTNVEGLTPTLSFITPYTGAGSPNLTTAVGAQLTGTQDRSFNLSYVIDLSKLLDQGDLQELAAEKIVDPSIVGQPSVKDPYGYCKHAPANSMEQGNGIEGSLGLKDILRDGLQGIDDTRYANVYGTKGQPTDPLTRLTDSTSELKSLAQAFANKSTRPASVTVRDALARAQDARSTINSNADESDQRVSTALSDNLSAQQDLQSKTAAAPPAPSDNSKSAGSQPASFGSTVDFTIVEGLNGGPTWSLKYFKGPGGGSTGLANLNRTLLDTLQITFVPTCASGPGKLGVTTPPKNPVDYWDSIAGCTGANGSSADVQTIFNQSVTAGQNQNTRMLLQSLIQQAPIP
jgi:hypothetical protein